MPNTTISDTTPQSIYKAAIVILLMITSFLGVRIYNKVDEMPTVYVTKAVYDHDCERQDREQVKMEKTLSKLYGKLDEINKTILLFHAPIVR